MNDLLNKALSMAEILTIKRDFDLLKKIGTQLKPEVAIQFTPFMALFCYEVIDYLKKKGQTIEVEQSSRFSLKDVRMKAKFFDMSTNKLFESIKNIDKIQDEEFIEMMKFPHLGYWNVHDNLGVYFDDNRNIVSNSHYAFYVFQDEKMLSNDQYEGYTLQGSEIRDFSYDMGRIIGSISSGLSSIRDFMVSDFSANGVNLTNHDFNTNRCTVFDDDNYKIIKLFLLHIVSSIGLLLFYLKKCIVRDTGLLLRLEYITYHYALVRLEGVKNYCEQNVDFFDDEKLKELLNSIDYSDKNKLRKTDFRNSMMHFNLFNKHGNPLIEESLLNTSKPLCGLVESQFMKMSYSEYQTAIEVELLGIYKDLYKYVDLI